MKKKARITYSVDIGFGDIMILPFATFSDKEMELEERQFEYIGIVDKEVCLEMLRVLVEGMYKEYLKQDDPVLLQRWADMFVLELGVKLF